MTFPERFKELRKRGNLTQAQAAAALGVVESTVRNWEKDSNDPKIETLLLVADATGASTDWLLGRPGATFEGMPKWSIAPSSGAARRTRARRQSEAEVADLRKRRSELEAELGEDDSPPATGAGK